MAGAGTQRVSSTVLGANLHYEVGDFQGPAVAGNAAMRIAVDARNLIRARSGIARSIENAVVALSGRVREIHLCLPDELHVDFAHLSRLSNIHIHVIRRPSILGRVWWSSFDLPELLRKIQPCVFWGPAHKLSAAAAVVAPSVLTIHDLVWKFAPETMPLHRRLGDRIMTGRAIMHAAQIIAVSVRTAADLNATFPKTRGKTIVVPNIVRPLPVPESKASLAALGIDRAFCLFVGTIEPRKNLPRAIRAYLSLPDGLRQRFRLVIAGGTGWKSEELQQLQVLHREEMLWLGNVSEQRLATLYAHCSFVVMPSLYEGFGYPAIEAKQFGKLLLTSHDSPMADLAGPGTVLVDPLDEGSIAAGFEACMRRFGRVDPLGLQVQASCFHIDAVSSALMEVFMKTKACGFPSN